MYHDLGAQVTLLEYLPAVVPLEDRDVSKELERSFTRRGIKVITNARFDAASVIADEDGVRITVGPEGKDATEIAAEMLLVAAGRATNVEDVGLETTSAEVDRGIVKVDGHMRTKEPHLYAIGDIVGGLMLAHTAAHEGIIAAHTIAGDPDVHAMDYVKQPQGHLLPSRDRLGGPDGAAVRGARPAREGREDPVPGRGQGDHRRGVRGLREDHRQRARRTRRWAST